MMMQKRAKLITFNVGNLLTLTAEEGMTWGEWLTSEYNTVGAKVEYNYIFFPTISRIIQSTTVTDIIVDGKLYKVRAYGGDN